MPTVEDYQERLRPFPINTPLKIDFYTSNEIKLATNCERILVGDRGPYVEFKKEDLIFDNIKLNSSQDRLSKDYYYYHEYRSTDDSNVKIYFQKKPVSYADYKIGYYYISPFDLYYLESKETIFGVIKYILKPFIVPLRNRY